MILYLLIKKSTLMKNFISVDVNSTLSSVLVIIIYAFFGALIYFALTIKNGVFKDIFGDKLLRKLRIIRK